MILDQRNHAFVVGAVGVVEVSFVHQNRRLARSFRDKLTHVILRRDAGGRIIWIADVNEPLLGRGRHLWEIMTEARSERNFHDLSAIDRRVIEDCFKSRIGCH